jgi:hypothetical protein
MLVVRLRGQCGQTTSTLISDLVSTMGWNARNFQGYITWSKIMTLAAISLLVARRGALGFAPRAVFGTRQSTRGVSRFASSTSSVIDEPQLMQGMLQRIRNINQMPDDIRASVLDFTVDGVMLGKVGPHFFRGEMLFYRIGSSHKFKSCKFSPL